MASNLKPIPKNQVRSRNAIEQHEHEDNASARRVVFVDSEGNFIGQDASTPLSVRLSDGDINIGTVNGELEVQLNHLDNDPDEGDVHDSVRIGDGVNQLKLNYDGSPNFPSGTLDAAGWLRTSSSTTILDVNFSQNKRPLIFDEQSTGAATITYDHDKASVLLNTTTASGDRAIFQTRRNLKYIPGKSQKFILTGSIGGLKANCVRRAGQFDDKNGVFIQLDEDASFVIRSSTSGTPTDLVIPRSEWNVDRFDGTGPSGISTDFSNQQLLFIDYLWLGSGVIRFGTLVNGRVIYAHIHIPTGINNAPWCRDINNPIRVEIENTDTTESPTTLQFTCAAVANEGTKDPSGALQTVNSGTSPKSFGSAGTRGPIISLRKRTETSKIPIIIEDAGVFAQSGDDFLIEIIKNANLTNASWKNTLSGISQFDTNATAVSGGEVIYSDYIRGGTINIISEILSKVDNAELGNFINGDSESLSIVATNLTNNSSIFGRINYREDV